MALALNFSEWEQAGKTSPGVTIYIWINGRESNTGFNQRSKSHGKKINVGRYAHRHSFGGRVISSSIENRHKRNCGVW